MPNASSKSTQTTRRDRADRSEGITKERLAHLRGIKEQIRRGFYNTEPVLEDLSHTFTRTVDAFI